MNPTRDQCEVSIVLQWGRTREGAEGSWEFYDGKSTISGFSGAAPVKVRKGNSSVPVKPGRACFSGAAPVKVRKEGKTSGAGYLVSTLQWGRTREGAEGRVYPETPRLRTVASVGPHP